jgi:hypothetical protein
MKNIIALSLFSLVFSVAACGDDGGDGNPGGGDGGVDEIPSLSASGSIVDFSTGDALTGGATVSADGLVPAPTISVTGSNFEITGIPPFSNFHLLAGSPPDYRSTYSTVVLVEDTNRTGLVVEALSEDFIDSLYSTFGVTEANGTSLVVAKLVDDQGAPVADVEAAAFELPATTDGPYFLDADKAPDALLTKSSSSGYVVVFNVEPGLASFSAAEAADLTMLMADSPVANRAATLAVIEVTDGALVIPTGVSFSADITPLFEERGCTICHSGSGPGKDLGGLHLNGESNKMYKELVEEVSAKHAKVRVDIGIPADSLMLTFPSKEDPPDIHPNVTFLSSSDPDYLLMLGWITEGALNN